MCKITEKVLVAHFPLSCNYKTVVVVVFYCGSNVKNKKQNRHFFSKWKSVNFSVT